VRLACARLGVREVERLDRAITGLAISSTS
jgi:hypothetical protein